MTRRLHKINGHLRQEISSLLLYELKDPRISTVVTIVSVDTSADLQHAKVLVSVMGVDEEKKTVLEVLNAAAGFFHRELRPRLSLKVVPHLRFVLDDSIEQGTRILNVMNDLSSKEGFAT